MYDFVGITLVAKTQDFKIAVWGLAVTSTGAELSGAWVFDEENIQEYEKILAGKLIVLMNTFPKENHILKKFSNLVVEISDFVTEAKNETKIANQNFQTYVLENELIYREFMAIEVSKRKLLPKVTNKKATEPEFHQWPETLVLEDSKKYLESQRKFGSTTVFNEEVTDILIAARTIQLLINMWREDEIERKNKVYLNNVDREITILPKKWLDKINN